MRPPKRRPLDVDGCNYRCMVWKGIGEIGKSPISSMVDFQLAEVPRKLAIVACQEEPMVMHE